jgi:hypothetical protein
LWIVCRLLLLGSKGQKQQLELHAELLLLLLLGMGWGFSRERWSQEGRQQGVWQMAWAPGRRVICRPVAAVVMMLLLVTVVSARVPMLLLQVHLSCSNSRTAAAAPAASPISCCTDRRTAH